MLAVIVCMFNVLGVVISFIFFFVVAWGVDSEQCARAYRVATDFSAPPYTKNTTKATEALPSPQIDHSKSDITPAPSFFFFAVFLFFFGLPSSTGKAEPWTKLESNSFVILLTFSFFSSVINQEYT